MLIETTAFEEQNPKQLHPDEWPTCYLYDAYAIKSGTSQATGLIDLFEVLEKGPFTVRGKVKRITKELEPFVRKPNILNHEIQIAQVRRWSIERLADKNLIIWALGNAAWYSIHPSEEYKPIYHQMLQKATIYNFIIDKYGRLSPKGPSLKGTVDQIYHEMSEESPILGTPEEVELLVEKYRRFIIAQLLEDYKFMRTPLWKFMKQNHPDEIEEIKTVRNKVTEEVQNSVNQKAERLSSPKVANSASQKKGSTTANRVTRNRSATTSSGSSDAGTSSKRKSRNQPLEQPGSQRRKTVSGEPSGTPSIRLAQKSRRSTRVIDSSDSSPTPQEPPSSQERLVISGRTTRSTKSPQDVPSSPSSPSLPSSPSEIESPIIDPLTTLPLVLLTKNYDPEAFNSKSSQKQKEQPPNPKPSVDTLKGLIKETHKTSAKTNSIPASKLSRVPGTRSASKANLAQAANNKVKKAGIMGMKAGSAAIPRSSRAQQKAAAPGVVPLDENHPGYDDLRDQAISKLTQLHALYQKISKSDSQTEYQKFLELADENAEWRKQHSLKPVYIDVIYATGYYTEQIKDSSFIQRVPDTEYLVDTTDWDFDTAVELLQNVNRGTYIHELLQPVKETRRNAMPKNGKQGRGRPRKNANRGIEAGMSELKISSVPSGLSLKDGQNLEIPWKCVGYDEKGNHCTFELKDATSMEDAQKASDHWRTCPLRQRATAESLEKKKANIEQAQTVLRDQQVRDPWTNLDHLVNFIEGEANKSRSWFPAGVC